MLINSNNVIIWGIIQICKICVYISGVAWPRKVWGGGATKKKERKSCIESGVWGRLGVLPQIFFTEIGMKFGNSRNF